MIQLLGWVLLQAVWQTFAAALLLLLSLRLMRRASAARRYRCAVLHLAGAIAAVALTVIVSHASIAAAPAVASLSNAPANWLTGVHEESWPLLSAAAWIWLGGIAIKLALLAIRFVRLRRFLRATAPAPQAIAAIVEDMSVEIGLRPPSKVRCADVRSPMVAGWQSPVLIVPRGFAETHPPAQMQALLAHEFAHIQRRDYSRNILQLIAASVLWWHPAAWLICARIKHERECASDEQAIRVTGSGASLASALFRLAEASMARESVLLAAHSSGLADRISRILEPRRCDSRKTMPWFFASAVVALTVIIVVASSAASYEEALTRAYAASAIGPSTVFTIRAHDPAGTFLVKMVRGRVVSIELGREAIPSRQVVQRGDTVRILGEAGQELLRLEVDPRGGFRWQPRSAS